MGTATVRLLTGKARHPYEASSWFCFCCRHLGALESDMTSERRICLWNRTRCFVQAFDRSEHSPDHFHRIRDQRDVFPETSVQSGVFLEPEESAPAGQCWLQFSDPKAASIFYTVSGYKQTPTVPNSKIIRSFNIKGFFNSMPLCLVLYVSLCRCRKI